MRILMVTDWNRGRGGAEAYMVWLKEGLEKSGDTVKLLTSSAGSAGDGKADYVALGSERKIAQAFLQIANPFAVRAIRRAVSVFRPDVVVVNMFAHHLSPAVLHVLGDIPFVLLVTDYKCICPIGSKLLPDRSICTSQPGWICCRSGCVSLPHWLRDRPRYALVRSGVAAACRVIACSDWVRRELGKSGIDSECIYLPVPEPGKTYSRAPSDHPTILFAGRLEVEKGVAHLLRAFARVSATNSDVMLRIAGQGPDKGRLESIALELGIEEKVTFLGWLDQLGIENELSTAWVLAAPSLWAEPLGLVALEAMVRGVPVVASRDGGFAETVEHGVGGLLIPNGDISALAESLGLIVSRRKFVNGLSSDAIRRVGERHDMTRHVERIRETLHEVLSAQVSKV